MQTIGNLRLDEIVTMRKRKKWRTIADFAGVSLSYLLKCVNEYGLNDGKRIYEQPPCMPKRLTSLIEDVVHGLGFETISDYIRERKLKGFTRQEMKSEIGITDYLIELHTPKDMKYFWHPKRNEKNMITLAKSWLNKSKMNADVLGKKLESKRKGVGVYYTPKGLLPEPLPIATGTGNFLKSAVDGLDKDELQNPPYGIKQ